VREHHHRPNIAVRTGRMSDAPSLYLLAGSDIRSRPRGTGRHLDCSYRTNSALKS
jgi:hypothetical protein